ncbi:MAG: 4-hydroxythreonine-4-phosphate dehydrogenase PdxA [Bacteroidales bacterium]
MNTKPGKNRTMGITMGDPAGIGPEIILKSFENPVIRNGKLIVIGNYRILRTVYDLLKIRSFELRRIGRADEGVFNKAVLNVLDPGRAVEKDFRPGKVQAIAGAVAFDCVVKAIEMAKNGEIDAIVTAPLNKEALHLAGHKYPGHTEILADLTGTSDFAMLLHDKKLSVIHVSTHVSLMDAITGLTRERIEKVIGLAHDFMKKLGISYPKIAVAGINPHAGENGLFGREEINEIIPAVRNMKGRGINVEGPVAPDTVFLQAVNGRYDIVVAMYHDQGHIPLKLLGFNSGVNVTVGLPFVRTSVDHGTAFEIAWQGIASEESMTEAIMLAIKLSGQDTEI